MKALTLTQPWATLVAMGAKRIETRSWSTKYRGRLAIHAAKSFPKEARALCFAEPFASVLGDNVDWVFGDLPTSAIVATCELIAVRKIFIGVDGWEWDGPTGRHWRYLLAEQERAFGDYTPGRYAWLLANIEPLPAPIPARGALGLWEWTPAAVQP